MSLLAPFHNQHQLLHVLQLLRQLYINADSVDKDSREILCKKITNKLVTQIQDLLVLPSASLPICAEKLAYTSPLLFLFETRQLFFHCIAFVSIRSNDQCVDVASECKGWSWT